MGPQSWGSQLTLSKGPGALHSLPTQEAASSHKPQSEVELGDGEWGCELYEVPSYPHDSGQASPDTVTALHGHTGYQQSQDGQPAASATRSTLTTAAPWLYQPCLHVAMLGCQDSGTLGELVRQSSRGQACLQPPDPPWSPDS